LKEIHLKAWSHWRMHWFVYKLLSQSSFIFSWASWSCFFSICSLSNNLSFIFSAALSHFSI